jgi:hypothetical protein
MILIGVAALVCPVGAAVGHHLVGASVPSRKVPLPVEPERPPAPAVVERAEWDDRPDAEVVDLDALREHRDARQLSARPGGEGA